MSTEQSSITGAPSVPTSDAGTQTSAEYTPGSTQDTTPAPQTEQPAGSATTGVQGEQQVTSEPAEDDVLAGVPTLEELNQLSDDDRYKKSLVQMRKAIEETFKPRLEKFTPFGEHIERFEQPEQLQEVLALHDSLLGWESDPQTGEPIPATYKGAEMLNTQNLQHADFLTADLLGLPTIDPATGRQVSRLDYVLESLAADPEQKAKALKILGGVEPGALAPRWAPDEAELAEVSERIDASLLETYKALDPDEREDLRLSKDSTLNRILEEKKVTADLLEYKAGQDRQVQQQFQQQEQYLNSQAQQAGNEYVSTQLQQALTTFHESVVKQCNFIQPLDPANLPSGMTPEQATQMNSQIAASNKAEAAQITGLIVSLFNPQTKAYVLPLLKEIGAVDDKLLGQMDQAANAFGNNGRNYGNLNFRGQQNANGQTFQPDQTVTQMSNEAQRALKTMLGYANQIRGRLMERRSQFFELKATEHNSTLNSAAAVRPPINGQGYNPTTAAAAAANLPTGKLTRAEIEKMFG